MHRRQFLRCLGLAAALPGMGRATLAAAESTPAAESAPAPAAAAPGGTHKILSCNVRGDLAGDARTGDSWAERREFCADVIRAQRPDLICLQECQQNNWKYLKLRLPEFDSFGLFDPGPVPHPMNTLFFTRARYELLSAGGFWLSEQPHVAGSKSWDTAYSRLVNWVHLRERATDRELRVWNTHLDHLGAVAREKQAELIVQAAAVFPAALPQLLTGDFNCPTGSPPAERIRAAGWTDTYAAVHGPKDPGFTFHGFQGPGFATHKLARKLSGKIDFIWCRGPVKTLAAEIIRDGRNGHYPSDHYFISAVVAM